MAGTETNKPKFTCALIKAHLVKNKDLFEKAMEAIEAEVESVGLSIVVRRHVDLAVKKPDGETLCEKFYAVHKDQPFFEDLKTQQAGLVIAIILKSTGEDIDAVQAWRKLIGSTNPKKDIADGLNTLRARFGESKEFNGFHGSDSEENALKEVRLLFEEEEIRRLLPECFQSVA